MGKISRQNFMTRKSHMEKQGIPCTNKRLSEVCKCSLRSMESYVSGNANVHPLVLDALAQYMDVPADWLTGDIVVNPEIIKSGLFGFDYEKAKLNEMESYLRRQGIVGIDNSGKIRIKGETVSIAEYSAYLSDVIAAIDFVTSRFVERKQTGNITVTKHATDLILESIDLNGPSGRGRVITTL